MEFFVNHTRKEIEFAGEDAHLNKFLGRLLELVETNHWDLKDDIQLLIMETDDVYQRVRRWVEDDEYDLNMDYWYVFFPEDDLDLHAAYDNEIAQEILRDNNRYGDRGWSGWDTPGATCDV